LFEWFDTFVVKALETGTKAGGGMEFGVEDLVPSKMEAPVQFLIGLARIILLS
jgi:hypothetical protein